MTILGEYVSVNVVSNVKYYEDKGYVIPRYKTKNRVYKVKKGTEISVKIVDLPTSSSTLVKYMCDYCNGENQITEKSEYKPYYKILKGRKDISKDCCSNKYCVGKKRSDIKKKKPVPKGKSFGEKYPHLTEEWSNKNPKSSFEYYNGSEELVWWDCNNCDSEYEMSLVVRGYHKCGCPYCRGRRVNRTNCLWTTHPEIAKMLRYQERGYEITFGRNTKEEFVCPDCEKTDSKIIQTVVKKGFSCPYCSDGLSYPEKFVFNVLKQLNLKVERQKKFKWSKNIKSDNQRLNGTKKYDFYLTDYDCIIEVHGEQHYYEKDRKFRNNLSYEQENDQLKEELAMKNGTKYYIAINCSTAESGYIKNNLLKSKLNEMFDLRVIDWGLSHSYAIHSLVKLTCESWMRYKNVKDVSLETDLSDTTVRRYLKQGSKIGLCDYDGKKEGDKTRKNNLEKISEIRSVRVVQLTEDGEFIKEWESATKARKELKINNIIAVCRGRQTTAGWFRWMYKEDYEKVLKEKGEVKFKTRQRIIQLTLDGEFVKEHRHFGEATKSVERNSKHTHNIKTSCENNDRTAYGFRWMYKEDYEKLNKNNKETEILK
jgi:hypothetical protein